MNHDDLMGLSKQLRSTRGLYRATSQPRRLHAEDETVHCVAGYLLRGVQTEREKLHGFDPRVQLHQDRALRAAFRKMYDREDIEQDGWVCKVCGWTNSHISARCRGYVDIPVARWRKEVQQRWAEDRTSLLTRA